MIGRKGKGPAWAGAASCVALTLATALPARAQEAPQGTFPAAFFAPYNPVTAADMVARVPGFELRDGDERRGFAATAGNLLINGERPSSKTAASELLKRIPAASVVRIELISGADAASDVRGQSQLVNVVVRQAEGGKRVSTTYVTAVRHIQYSNRIGWIAQVSPQIALSPKADLSLDFQMPNLLGRSEIHEAIRSPAGALTGERFQLGMPNNIWVQGSATLRWRPTAADTVNLTAQFSPVWNETDIVQLEAAPNGALRNELIGHTDYDRNWTGEFGGDWEHRFSPGLSVKLIGLVSNGSVDQTDVFQIFTAPATRLTRTQERSTRNGERIGRAQVKWTLSKAHTLEFGGEGAFNYRETSLDIVSQPLGGPATPVPLAVADARVEEVRGEAFVTDVWTAGPRLTVEGGLNIELSRITQSGDQAKERSFRYFKPRLTATYVASARNTLRFSLIRDVAQLDFAEFSSAVDFVNISTVQGNPDLVPEKAWKSRLEWETRFAPRTALTLALFADRVEDVHDLVAIGGFDAYGNIGNGSRVGAEVRTAVPLDALGIGNAELRFNGLYQRTRVTDPITGQKRSFSVPFERSGSPQGSATLNAGNKDWAYVVSFRQNLPQWKSAWGGAVVQWSGREEYRRAEIWAYRRARPKLDLFAETTAIRPVTLRAYVSNLLGPSERRTRTFFVGDRASGVIQRVEARVTDGGPEGSRVVGVQVSGRF